ncbi:MAG: pyridoxamine 5'-phosphate oxidase family protein [Marmoricola sp.]|nr:pyridoxamine 5'-phosphate oxidase family protein [Marmoricola sp.]
MTTAEPVSARWTEIDDVDALTALVGEAAPAASAKERQALVDVDVQWLQASPFCVIATSDADGRCDASPKGDPAGSLVHVIDETTIAIAERPGNRRVDGYRNVLQNPHVGLVFVIPGRGDTLRINGRARLVSDAPFFDEMAVQGKRPLLALVVEVEEVFHHCSKSFLRSQIWDPATWDPTRVPRRAVLAQQLERPGETVQQLDEYYDSASYAKRLY